MSVTASYAVVHHPSTRMPLSPPLELSVCRSRWHAKASAQTIVEAGRAFATARRLNGEALDDDWLNNGPSSLVPLLPEGWRDRTVVAFARRAVTLRALGRDDMLKTKLFDLCDRSTDLGDCLALRPTPEELRAARPWVEQQDANPEWPAHVRATLDDLARRLGHGS
jgi:hypothetical protein